MLDVRQAFDEENHLLLKYRDDPEKLKKLSEKLPFVGKFILLSSDNYEMSEIMPLYYTRQAIEEVFDISKNFADLLPLRAHSEETIRGRLLISFITTILYSIISNNLANTKLSATNIFYHLHNWLIKIYETVKILEEPTKVQKESYQLLNIDYPFEVEAGNPLAKNSPLSSLKSSGEKKDADVQRAEKTRGTPPHRLLSPKFLAINTKEDVLKAAKTRQKQLNRLLLPQFLLINTKGGVLKAAKTRQKQLHRLLSLQFPEEKFKEGSRREKFTLL
jgi:hypothetical protein